MVDKPKAKADLKVVILGDGQVGKTSFINRYISGSFTSEVLSTLGAAFTLKRVGNHNVAIWDTAGQERYAGLSSFYCRDAGAVIMAFDLNSLQSFESLRSRFLTLLGAAPENSLKVVIGTKLDTVDEGSRQVTADQGRRLAAELNSGLLAAPGAASLASRAHVPYFETSSLDGTNVTEVFDYIYVHQFKDHSANDSSSSSSRPSPPQASSGGGDKIDLSRSSSSTKSVGGGAQQKKGCCG